MAIGSELRGTVEYTKYTITSLFCFKPGLI